MQVKNERKKEKSRRLTPKKQSPRLRSSQAAPPGAAAKGPRGCSEDAGDNRSGEPTVLLIGSYSGVRYLGSKLQTSDNLFSKFIVLSTEQLDCVI